MANQIQACPKYGNQWLIFKTKKYHMALDPHYQFFLFICILNTGKVIKSTYSIGNKAADWLEY